MPKIKLEITTPTGVVYNNEIESVVVRTNKGNIGLQAGKSPFMGNVVISEMDIYEEKNQKPRRYAISEGLVLATPELINIITDSCEEVSKIDIQRAIKAREFALMKIKQHKSKEKILQYENKLKKEINRIDLYNSKR